MTREENNQLIELLKKKKAEVADSIEYIVEICDGDKEMEWEETRHLHNLSCKITATLSELTSEYGAQATIDHINAEEYINTAHTTSVEATFEDLLQATIGKKLHNHDSWNGSSMTITIEDHTQEDNSVRFIGTNPWGGKSGIFVNKAELYELLTTGHAEHERELEGCTTKETWDLK